MSSVRGAYELNPGEGTAFYLKADATVRLKLSDNQPTPIGK